MPAQWPKRNKQTNKDVTDKNLTRDKIKTNVNGYIKQKTMQ